MRGETLRRFFVGEATRGELATELQGTWTLSSTGEKRFSCSELNEAFRVRPEHLVRVCDAVLAGQLAPTLLESIGCPQLIPTWRSMRQAPVQPLCS